MEAVKISLEGITASFRYPHFTWGRQPTYQMPPPSTIYGLISAAAGEWIEPESVRFAYYFTYLAKAADLEHIHAVVEGKGTFLFQGEKIPKNMEGKVNPLYREFLFQPKLTLYLDRTDLIDYFKEPRYTLSLGRSQDLLTLTTAELIQLQSSEHVYFEHTILPWEFRPYTNKGISVMMPRYIDTMRERDTKFERYVVLQQRLFSTANQEDDILSDHSLLTIKGANREYWFDPSTPSIAERKRGVLFHSFV